MTALQMDYIKKNSYESDNKYKFKSELAFLKDSVDLSLLLFSLGFSVSKETSAEFRASCIIHGGDNSTSFRFNKKTRTWSCFSHACDSIYGKDIIALIRACKKCSFMEAVSFLKDLTGHTGNDISVEAEIYRKEKEKKDFINEFSSEETNVVRSKFLDESILKANMFLRSDFFIKEGFSKNTLDYFNIAGGYTDLNGIKRDVIPIRDFDGVLMGCAFSSTNRATKHKDKYIFSPNFDKEHILYNFNNAINFIDDKPLVLVEGFKSVWRLYEYGIYNVSACMGTSVTEGQKDLLLNFARHGVVLFFDNDGPGISGVVRSFSNLNRKLKVYFVFITEMDSSGKGLDPADLSKELVYNYLNGYV